jgi:hypothetical protein
MQIVGFVQKKEWERARSALRLYTYETRKSMTRLSAKDPVPYISKNKKKRRTERSLCGFEGVCSVCMYVYERLDSCNSLMVAKRSSVATPARACASLQRVTTCQG